MKKIAHPQRIVVAAVTVASFFFPPPVLAQHADAGTTVFPFLHLGYDARTVGLAGASVAMPGDLRGVLSNPAAMGYIQRQQISVGYRPVPGGLHGAPLAYARPVKDMGSFAFSMIGLTSGAIGITEIDNDGKPVATGGFARADFIAGTISWGKMLNAFSAVGFTLKGIYNYLGSPDEHFSADGFAVDGGIQFRSLDSRLIYGFAVRNFGMLRSGYTKEDGYKLPAVVEIGVSYIPRHIETLRIALDINKKSDDYLVFEPAFEWEVIRRQMLLRAGYGLSWPDAQAAMKVLRGVPDDNYVKTNRAAFCAGAGFMTQLVERPVKFDAAVEFSDKGIAPPVLVLSMLVDL